jgi:hypothetical protein
MDWSRCIPRTEGLQESVDCRDNFLVELGDEPQLRPACCLPREEGLEETVDSR